MSLDKKLLQSLIFSFIFLFFCNISHSANLIVEIGYHFGGDELAVTSSENSNTYNINAGELISVSVGSHIYFEHNLYVRGLIGIKSTFGFGDNGDVSWSRFPIEAMTFIRVKKWSFGAGMSYHLNPKLSGGFVSENNITNSEYKNTLGFIFEVDYQQGESTYFGIKYTVINYESTGSIDNVVNGNSVGLVGGYVY